MEHSLSDDAMDRLARFFELLAVCPHGGPYFLPRFHSCSLVHPDVTSCEDLCEHVAASDTGRPGADIMSIADLRPGQLGRVTHVNARGAVRQRLLDMGILPEVEIEVERVAPSGDPLWIKLMGFQLALRKSEAAAVLVTTA